MLEKLVDSMILNKMCKEEEKEIIVYGLTMGIEFIAMIITIIVLGLGFGLIFEGLVFFLSFYFIRSNAGGYHNKSGISCYFSSTTIILGFFLVIKFLQVELMSVIGVGLLIIAIPIILKLAPISTENNPFDDSAEKHFRKKVIINLLIESVLILALLVSGFNMYGFIIALGIFVSGILVLIQKVLSSQ